MAPLSGQIIQILRCWVYGRISRDEDENLNSMLNQMAIGKGYVEQHGHSLVGESFDDNKTGMNFDREGFAELLEAAEDGRIDAVIVKDLSRLGRHRSETDRVIEYLLTCGVRVISVTEGIDTSIEGEDLNIGFRLMINDFYARDTSRKIRTGYRKKQETVGVVILPPFGMIKDLYTKEVSIYPETAEIVQMIYKLYIEGYGDRRITQYLVDQKIPSPSYWQKILYNKKSAVIKPREMIYTYGVTKL